MFGRFTIALLLASAAGRSEIIDRVAVTVGNQVITESQMVRELRLAAFLNGDSLDVSSSARRKAADRLIEQMFIRNEIDVGAYAPPSATEVEPLLLQVRTQRFHTPQEYHAALEKYRITEEDLKTYLLWQLTLLRFIDIRFRAGIQISEQDIRQYFNKELPQLEKKAGPGAKISLETLRDKIQQSLIDERIDRQIDDWLNQLRKRTRIDYYPEAFQ
jgi:hypothetical protein